jgi:ribonuclease BN (tRNA processing enzyme)
VPEVAFTGDTTSDFITNKANQDALNAKLLIMESTFLDNYMSVEKAHEYGHTHFSEIVALGDHFKNKNIVLTHFSARYTQEVYSCHFRFQVPSTKHFYFHHNADSSHWELEKCLSIALLESVLVLILSCN